jgi:aminoglycoside phosphotransferase family enzyme/predicted kinase
MTWEELKNILEQPGFWPEAGPVEAIETHISGVFLVGERAYKVKKPVDLGFVDFSTLEKRRHFCEEEIRLNRRLAPDLYLGVRTIADSSAGPVFEGEGSPIEYAVEMVRFDQEALMVHAEEEGRLTFDHMDQLAKLIADFHAECPIAAAEQPFGNPDYVCRPVEENFRHLLHEHIPDELQPRLEKLRDWSRAEHQKLRESFAERKASGCVRECHGDMHLGNMILRDDTITVFDCIEFNDSFRWIDVSSEVAFCTMDLADRGQPQLAHHFLNAYLEVTGDYAGLTVLPYYLCYRAMVRAKVAWLRLQQHPGGAEEEQRLREELEEYIEMAERYAFQQTPQLIVMHGVSGTGKSYGAEQIVHELGAIRVRSDVERKRMAERQPVAELYSHEMSKRVYGRLHQFARTGLRAGFPMLLDATYLHKPYRSDALQVAREVAVPCHLLNLTASEATLRERIRRRAELANDASDADEQILELQLKTAEPLTAEEQDFAIQVDTEQPDCWPSVIRRLRRK